MKLMVRLNMVHEIPKVVPHEGVCEGCCFGKNHWESFEKEKSWRENTPLEFVHSDLCIMKETSSIFTKNFVSLIVVFIGLHEVSLMNSKDMFVEKLKESRALTKK